MEKFKFYKNDNDILLRHRIHGPRIVGEIELPEFKRDNDFRALPDNSHFCCYCGERFQATEQRKCTKDHLIPLSKGGRNYPRNKRNCCYQCNNEKGNFWLEDWLQILLKKPKTYRTEAQIENIKYVLVFVQTAGSILFRDASKWEWYKRTKLLKQSIQ